MTEIFEENEENIDIVLTATEDFVSEIEDSIEQECYKRDARRQLEELLKERELSRDLEDFGD